MHEPNKLTPSSPQTTNPQSMGKHTITETLTQLEQIIEQCRQKKLYINDELNRSLNARDACSREVQRIRAGLAKQPRTRRNKYTTMNQQVCALRRAFEQDMDAPEAYWNRLQREEWKSTDWLSYIIDNLRRCITEILTPLESRQKALKEKKEQLEAAKGDNPTMLREYERICAEERHCMFTIRLWKKPQVISRWQHIQDETTRLNSYKQQAEAEEKDEQRLQDNLAAAETRLQQAKDAVKEKSATISSAIAAEQEQLATIIQRCNRRLKDLNHVFACNPDGLAKAIPWGIVNGWQNRISLSWAKGMPLSHALYCNHTPDNQRLIGEIVTQILSRSKSGSVRLLAMDPMELGKSFRLYQTTPPLLEGGYVITELSECDTTISNIVQQMTVTIQQDLGNRYQTWRDLHDNTANKPYTLLLIHHAEKLLQGLNSHSAEKFKTLLQMGKDGGVGVIMTLNMPYESTREMEKIQAVLTGGGAMRLDTMHEKLKLVMDSHPSLSMNWVFRSSHDEATIHAALQKQSERRTRAAGKLEDFWLPQAVTDHSSAHELRIPIGWNERTGEQHDFVFNSQEMVHALVGGQTGSGKSVLLHVILHSLLAHYTAEELHLYLLDFKEGVEMISYHRNPVPPVQLVAMHSDSDYGNSFLDAMYRMMAERDKLFAKVGVQKFDDYRDKDHKMPRVLVVIDECQNLFNSSPRWHGKDEIAQKMSTLVRQSRNAGIHFLFCTQTISSLSFTSDIWKQVTTRIALKCRETDSTAILSASNTAASRLSGPGKAIFNDSNGLPEYNIHLRIPLCKNGESPAYEHLLQLADKSHKVRLYDGVQAPELPEIGQLRAVCAERFSLVFGATPDFDSVPFCLPLRQNKDFPTPFRLLACIDEENLFQGLLQSAIRSAAATDRIRHIQVIGPGEEVPGTIAQEQENLEIEGVSARLTYNGWSHDDDENCDILDQLADTETDENQQQLIIFYRWNHLHLPAQSTAITARNSNKAEQRFRAMLENTSAIHRHIILLADSYIKDLPVTQTVPLRMAHCRNNAHANKVLALDAGLNDNAIDHAPEHRYNIFFTENGGSKRIFRGFLDPTTPEN